MVMISDAISFIRFHRTSFLSNPSPLLNIVFFDTDWASGVGKTPSIARWEGEGETFLAWYFRG